MNKEKLEQMSCFDNERRLREMINSCLCYGNNIHTNKYVQEFRNNFTEEEFNRIVKSQEDYFKKHAKIIENVYTDNEDVTYNSIIWD